MFSQLPCFGVNTIRLTSSRARAGSNAEGSRRVGVDVVAEESDLVRIAALQQGGDFFGPVHSALAGCRLALGGQSLAEHEDRACPLVLIVNASRMIFGGGNRCPGFLDRLYRLLWIVGFFFKHLFHACDELRIGFRRDHFFLGCSV